MSVSGAIRQGVLSGVVAGAGAAVGTLREQAKQARALSLEAKKQDYRMEVQKDAQEYTTGANEIANTNRVTAAETLAGVQDNQAVKQAGLLRGGKEKGVNKDTGTSVSVGEWNAMSEEDQNNVVGKEMFKNTLAISLATAKALTPKELEAATASQFTNAEQILSTTKGWSDRPASVRIMMTNLEALKMANPNMPMTGTKVIPPDEVNDIAKKFLNKEIDMFDIKQLDPTSQQAVFDAAGDMFTEKDTLWSDFKAAVGDTLKDGMKVRDKKGYTPGSEAVPDRTNDPIMKGYKTLKSTFEGLRPKTN